MIQVRVNELIGQTQVNDWCQELSENGIEIEISEYKNKSFAALEWLLPTGIVLYIAKPYFEAFLQEAAKDHYQLIKKIISEKIYKRHFGDSSEKLIYVNQNGLKESFFSNTFSIETSIETDDQNLKLKLLLPENSNADDVINAFSKFSLYVNNDSHVIASSLLRLDKHRAWSKVLWLNSQTQNLELIDVVESSIQKQVVSITLE